MTTMDIAFALRRTVVKITNGESEKVVELLGGTPDSVASDLLSIVQANGLKIAHVTGEVPVGLAARFEKAGIEIVAADSPAESSNSEESPA